MEKITSLNQFLLLFYATKDKRLSDGDIAVLAEIINSYLKYSDRTRPVGDTHLSRETGRSDGAVKASKGRLIRCRYLKIAQLGRGTSGTTYIPNFEWQTAIAAEVKAEIDRREAAKKSKASGAANKTTKRQKSAGLSADPLNKAAGKPVAPLRDLVVPPDAPQTYLEPVRLLNRTHASALAPYGLGGACSELCEVIEAIQFEDDGDVWLNVKFAKPDGSASVVEFILEAPEANRQAEGQAELTRFMTAVGLARFDEPSDLVGRRFMKHGDDFTPVANDNENMREAA